MKYKSFEIIRRKPNFVDEFHIYTNKHLINKRIAKTDSLENAKKIADNYDETMTRDQRQILKHSDDCD